MSVEVLTSGGGGGLYASIFVYGVFETDAVIASFNGKTISGRWVESSAGNGFLIAPIKAFGMWTVTVTRSGLSQTKEVLVDVATEFDVVFPVVIYDKGNEYSDATGGWATYSEKNNGTTAEKRNDCIYLYSYNDTGFGRAGAYTANKIDLTPFSEVHVQFEITAKGGSAPSYSLTVGKTLGDYGISGAEAKYSISESSLTTGTFEGVCDIANLTEKMFVCIGSSGNNSKSTVTSKTHKIWLE